MYLSQADILPGRLLAVGNELTTLPSAVETKKYQNCPEVDFPPGKAGRHSLHLGA